MECPELMTALQSRLAGRDEPVDIEECMAELERVISALSNPRHRESLLVAMRFDPRYLHTTVTARRAGYNEDLRRARDPEVRKRHVDTLRTLERRENDGIEAVARLLAVAGGRPRHGVPPHPPDRPATGLITEAIAFTCHFSASGAITTNTVTRWVRAPASGGDGHIKVAHQYYSESRPGVLRLSRMIGCRPVEVREATGGGIVATLAVLKELRPQDGPYSFEYDVVVDSDVRAEQVFSWKVLTTSVRRAEFRLIFDAAMCPVTAWWFSTLMDIESQIEPPAEQGRHLEILDDGRYLCKIFESEDCLVPNMHYGIGWKWPL
jgi:hypothetical protein